jgi:hypothetical protein
MKPKTKTTASLAVVGVDIGKEVFHLRMRERQGAARREKKTPRA